MQTVGQLSKLADELAALGHPTRLTLLRISNEKASVSPTDLASEATESLGVVSYHVRQLAQAKLLKLVGTIPRRGAVEHRYAVTARGKRLLAALESL